MPNFVRVKEGNLLGKLEQTQWGQKYVSFRGIPYAKPPLGLLRFKSPQPPENWTGIRDATEHGNKALHENTKSLREFEDCLYLNVYVPLSCWINASKGSFWTEETQPKTFPVIVWFDGGSVKVDSGNSEDYGHEYFMHSKDILLVTVNYRIEVLGFLSLGNSDIPGNAGLKDQVAALKWVNRNIFNFGGDPNNISLFANNTGSVSETFHLFSDLSCGLFHRMIAQSGVRTNFWTTTSDSLKLAFKLGKHLGKETSDEIELTEFFMSLPAEDLVGLFDSMAHVASDLPFYFGPVVESTNDNHDAFLVKPVEELLSQGKFNHVPLMLGYSSDKRMSFSKNTVPFANEINEDIARFLPLDLFPHLTKEQGKDIADEIENFYFSEKLFTSDIMSNMIQLRNDISFCLGIQRFAKLYAAKSNYPVYFYVSNCETHLNHSGKLGQANDEALTSHCDDLLNLFSGKKAFECDSHEGMLINRAVKLWSNMATFGNPTPKVDKPTGLKWLAVTGQQLNFSELGMDFEGGMNPANGSMRFWEKIYNKVVETRTKNQS